MAKRDRTPKQPQQLPIYLNFPAVLTKAEFEESVAKNCNLISRITLLSLTYQSQELFNLIEAEWATGSARRATGIIKAVTAYHEHLVARLHLAKCALYRCEILAKRLGEDERGDTNG